MRDRRVLGIHPVAPIFDSKRFESLRREVLRERMHCAQMRNELAYRLGERFVGKIHIGPERIAADRGNLFGVENRRLRRPLQVGDVVVPAVAVGAMRRIVLQHHHLGRRLVTRIERVNVERPETGREIALLKRRQRLSLEEEHEMVVERAANLRHRVVAERRAKVEALNGRADRRRQRLRR